MTKEWRFLLFAASLVGFTTPVGAQGTGAYAHVGAFCMADFVQITVAGIDDGTEPDVVGFDIFRTTLGICDSAPVRVTDTPIPRGQEAQFTLRFDDSQVVPGLLYEYRVVGVDAERSTPTELSRIFPGSSTNDSFYAGCGDIPLGPGTLVDDGDLYRYIPCPGVCFPVFHVDPSTLPQLAEFVDTPTPLRLEGRFIWAFGTPLLAPDRFAIGACGTAVAPTTWTGLKRLYR